MELSTIINVLVVSSNQDSATNLLNSCISGLSTSDNQEWTGSVGSFAVKCYVKYPGCDLSRRGASNHLDMMLVGVTPGDEKEAEVLAYSANKLDCAKRYYVGGEAEGLTSTDVDKVNELLLAHSEALVKFNETFKKLVNGDNDTIIGETIIEKLLVELGYTEHISTFISALGNYDNFDLYVDYNSVRKLYASQTQLYFEFYRTRKLHNRLTKIINVVQSLLNTMLDLDESKLNSSNSGKFELLPTTNDSNGIGFTVDLKIGEEFNKENSNLPLVVRDNLVTIAIEIHAKNDDASKVDEIIATLEKVKDMAGQFGLISILEEKFGIKVSFSKEGGSAFIDLVAATLIGEEIINKIRSLNLEKFKFSLNDTLRVQTGVNVKELYEDFDLESITKNIAKLSIVGEGQILNLRALIRLFNGVQIISTNKSEQQLVLFASSIGLMLTTFESLGCTIKYDSEILRGGLMETIDSMNKKEGFCSTMIGMGTQMVTGQFLPMGLNMLEGLKPMLEMFGDGLSAIDLDRLSVEILVPSVRLALRSTLLLPGLNEFVEKKILN